MMVAAISATPNPKTSSRGGNNQNNPARPPLLPSEGDNVVPPPLRRPKSREVTSRYMSSSSSISATPISTSRRCPSPSVSRTATQMTPMPCQSLIKRSQSAERRRPATPRPGTPGNAGEVTSTAAKMLFTSTRSLSVSFQGESFSLKISKAKPAPTPSVTPSMRKGTPERRKTTPLRGGRGDGSGGGTDQGENSKQIDQHRWPGRLRQVNSLSRSMDCTDERRKLDGSGNVVRALQNSMIDERSRTSTDGRLKSEFGNVELEKTVELVIEANSATGSAVPSDSAASDAESVSSGSTSGAQEFGGAVPVRGGNRGIMVPARFWQETNNRLRQGRLSEPNSPQSKSMALKTTATPKLTVPKKVSDTPVLSPRPIATNRGLSSPLRGSVRPASPSKFSTSAASSPLRGTSPSRTRNGVAGTLGSNLSNIPSILSFVADARRGKMGENRIDEAHLLRLLYNRLLQWRYVNARADAANSAQTMTAERSLFNAWVTISKLRDSVRDKRIMMQMLRQNLKLASILKEQMVCLEDWAHMDRDHSSSLSGTVEAFKASTLRLPIVGGARAEVQNLKDAICSAVDVMQAMASSICSLLSKVDGMNYLVCELASIASNECAMLNQCKDLLSTIAAMQVKDCSLRTHILQLHRIPSSLTTEL